MKATTTEIVTLDVERVAHTGEGVATLAGATLLVRGALPGERVTAAVVHRGKVTRAQTLEVLAKSPERVEPACPHALRCGGCDLMHASLALQREVRRAAVLQLLGGAVGEPLPEPALHTPSPALGYRSRARLSLRCQGGAPDAGYRRSRSHELAPIDDCVVLRAELRPAIGLLSELVNGSHGEGEAQIALGAAQKVTIDLRWSGRLDRAVFARADRAVTAGQLGGVQIWEGGARTPASFGDARACVPGLDGRPLFIPAGGFAQASDEGAQLLATRVGELAALRAGGLTIELFAGSGTLTIAAIPSAERYVAVEADDAAAAMLRENLSLRGLVAKVMTADAEDYALKRPLATVILDPPRAGAPRACEHVAAARPRQIIYVSCNPATLARDLTKLPGYRLEQLEIVELFPQTSHVETIVRLVRR